MSRINYFFSLMMLLSCAAINQNKNDMLQTNERTLKDERHKRTLAPDFGVNETHGNIFHGPFNNTPGYRTFTINSDGAFSSFWVLNALTDEPEPNGSGDATPRPIIINESDSPSLSQVFRRDTCDWG